MSSSADEHETTSSTRSTCAESSTRSAPVDDGARCTAVGHEVPVTGSDRVRTSIDCSGTSDEGSGDLVLFVVHAGSVQIDSRVGAVLAGPGDAALHVFPDATTDQHHVAGPGSTAPATVRRAVAHLEAHAHEPVQPLQDGSRRHLGTTPTGHLRRVRLERARRDLQQADPTGAETVAAAAARWGSSNAGRCGADGRPVPPAATTTAARGRGWTAGLPAGPARASRSERRASWRRGPRGSSR